MQIRKGDVVEIITGADASKAGSISTGRVLRVLHDQDKVVVEGVNKVWKHLKPSRRNPQGGRLSKEMPLAVSNVQLYCPTCRRGVRVGRRYNAQGAKERFCKKCGNGLGGLSKPRKAYAKKS